MRKLGIFWACALMSHAVFSAPGLVDEEKISERVIKNFNIPIRVLLEKQASHGAAKSHGTTLYLSPANSKWERIGSSAKLHIEIRNGTPVLLVNDLPFSGRALYLRGGPIASDILSYKGKKYRGALRITLRENRFNVVNVLPIEDYLEGMLASEMSPSWELEALKAQAVAARSYALYMVKHPKNTLYDLEAGTQDQVYGGVEKETARVKTAVKETAGIYLGFRHEPIKAFFHSRCGGTTETAQTVWNHPSPAHRSRVNCPFCRNSPAPWHFSVGHESFFQQLNLPYQKSSPFSLSHSLSPSGRVSELKIQTTQGHRQVTSDELRAILGYTKMKSAFFDWKIGKEDIFFDGKGNGHGVGMCQWGARQFAREGKGFRDILTHYYPEATIYDRKPWPNAQPLPPETPNATTIARKESP